MYKKKRKATSEPGVYYTDMGYDAKTESLKTPSKPSSETTSPSYQLLIKNARTAVKSTSDIELDEYMDLDQEPYESMN